MWKIFSLALFFGLGCKQQTSETSSNVANNKTIPGTGSATFEVRASTVIKKSSTAQSINIDKSEKCNLFKGSKFRGEISSEKDGHFFVKVTHDVTPSCQFRSFYMFKGHVNTSIASQTNSAQNVRGTETNPSVEEPPAPTVVENPTQSSGGFGNTQCVGGAYGKHSSVYKHRGTCALLSAIAWAEGTNNRYDVFFTFRYFDLRYASGHPRKNHCSGGLCSTAAGRYQILDKTWDSVVQSRLNLPDFREESQDRAGVHLLQNRSISQGTHRAVMTYQTFVATMNKLSWEWASLPPGRYGQPKKPMSVIWAKYKRFTGR